MKYEVYHVDTCIPDYWSGHHLPHVQIPVWHGMSLKDIKEGVKSELAQGMVMGSTDEARLLSADIIRPEEEKQADRLTKAVYAAVNRMRPAKKGQRRFFTDLEPLSEEDLDSGDYFQVYAFFVFAEISDK